MPVRSSGRSLNGNGRPVGLMPYGVPRSFAQASLSSSINNSQIRDAIARVKAHNAAGGSHTDIMNYETPLLPTACMPLLRAEGLRCVVVGVHCPGMLGVFAVRRACSAPLE